VSDIPTILNLTLLMYFTEVRKSRSVTIKKKHPRNDFDGKKFTLSTVIHIGLLVDIRIMNEGTERSCADLDPSSYYIVAWRQRTDYRAPITRQHLRFQ
jgi:hypothetical protein